MLEAAPTRLTPELATKIHLVEIELHVRFGGESRSWGTFIRSGLFALTSGLLITPAQRFYNRGVPVRRLSTAGGNRKREELR